MITNTTTPVPETYRVSWSHSGLTTFDTCPHRFWAEKIAKVAVDSVQHPTTLWGLAVHKALEDNGMGAPLPDNMTQYEAYAKGLNALAMQAEITHYEFKMGVTRDWEASTFDESGTWGRCISDALMLYQKGSVAICIDHKLGKYRGPTNQAVINAKFIMTYYPTVEVVKTSFNYLAADIAKNDVFYRSSIDDDFMPVQRLIAALESAVAFQNFPMKRNGLCRQYCPVHTCPHNGKYQK
jgi:hypothetical protein